MAGAPRGNCSPSLGQGGTPVGTLRPASSDSRCTSLGRTHVLPFHEELRFKVEVRGADKSPTSRVRGRSGHLASEASWGGLERSLPSTPSLFQKGGYPAGAAHSGVHPEQ